MGKRFKILFLAALLIMVSGLAIGGYEKGTVDKAKPKEDLYGQLELFADTISLIKSDYVDEVDSKRIVYGAMRGMLESLDDFSQFLEPDEYNELKSDTSGEFGGIGIEVSSREGILTVITPIVDTPAQAAGVKPGDKIVKIDGKTTKNLTLSGSVKKLRGDPGTTVTLTLWREKDDKVFEVSLKRAVVKINSIKKATLIAERIGYIKLVEFQDNTPRDLEDALKRLESQGMDSLILDLRNNPGGILEGALDVCEKFLAKDKAVVSIKARAKGQSEVFSSSGKYTHKDYPFIVMINEGSASASEIVAGAIQDNKRGIILGTKSFGKASVQTVIPLRDGSAIRLTTAVYYTPGGKMIRDQGITPDVVVKKEGQGGDDKDEDLDIFEKVEAKEKAQPKGASVSAKDTAERDNQLDMAINLMKSIKIYKTRKD